MINVTNSYLEKSLAPGRAVKCTITADDYTYTDAEILSFEFNDVVHPDDLSFGTACANRFHFEVWSKRIIPLTAVIKPVVFFEGEAAGCPLGEFYITRRYRKKERYSVTCYDRMYKLDSRYRPKINFPCTARQILADIAAQHEFTAGFTPAADMVDFVPRQSTCREVIGYIAGMNGGFAKFDRGGVLRLRKLALCDFTLNRNQYINLSLKADRLDVRQIDFIGDEEVFSKGKGTKLTTYRQYNPLANEAAAERVFSEWGGFSYHGMTVKMRGLPFLESGDSILVQDDSEDRHYLALISDYTLEYDGGLRATLTSKSKNPIDEYDDPMSRKKEFDALSERLRMVYYSYINDRRITLSQTVSGLASINFHLDSGRQAVFNSQFNVTAASDCVMTISYFINNVKVGQEPKISLCSNRPQRVSVIRTVKLSILKYGGVTHDKTRQQSQIYRIV